MSQVKRYNLAWTAKAEDPQQGAWVEWKDYAALVRLQLETLEERNKAEAENERLRSASFVTAVPSEQYERLCSAGDELARLVISGAKIDIKHHSITRWLAAKEGKPLTKHEDDIRRGLRTK